MSIQGIKRGKQPATIYVVVLLCCLGFSGVAWQLLRPKQPAYQGRRLGDWLADLDVERHSPENAARAVRAIGTNSFPVLRKMLSATDPAWKRCLMAFNSKQSLIEVQILPATVIRYRAVQGYSALGAVAKPEVGALIQMMESETNPEAQSDIAAALGEIGPEAKPAIPVLMKAARSQHRGLSQSALFAVGNILILSPSDMHFDTRPVGPISPESF